MSNENFDFEAEKRMEWLTGFFIIRYHFVYQILMLTKRVQIKSYGTIGVRVSGVGFELIYDPDFINTLTDEELTFILYHEVLHIALHHVTKTRIKDQTYYANLTADLAVNEIIPTVKGSCDEPKDAITVGRFAANPKYSDIKYKQSWEYYFEYFQEKGDSRNSLAVPQGYGSSPKKKNQENSESQNQENTDTQNQENSESQKGFKDGCPLELKEIPEGGVSLLDSHEGWGESEVLEELVRHKIAEIERNNSWGDISQDMKEIITAAQVKKINWKNIIRQIYGNFIWHDRESTRKKPNRRTGLVHPGNRKSYVDKHLVCVDTSGSMDSKLLSMCLSVINQMTDYMPIDLMQFDCDVTEEPKPFDKRYKEYQFKGRGGTDFQPVIDLVDKKRYKSVIILTDGCASSPSKPRSADVIWALPEGCSPPVDWGKKVFMSLYS